MRIDPLFECQHVRHVTVATDVAAAESLLLQYVVVEAVEQRSRLRLLLQHVCFVPVAHDVAVAESLLSKAVAVVAVEQHSRLRLLLQHVCFVPVVHVVAVSEALLSKAVAVVAVEQCSHLQLLLLLLLLLLLQHVCFVLVAHVVAVAKEPLQLLTLPCSSLSRAAFVSKVCLQKAPQRHALLVRSPSSSLVVHSVCSFLYVVPLLFRGSLIGLCCCCC